MLINIKSDDLKVVQTFGHQILKFDVQNVDEYKIKQFKSRPIC